jgi:hypothetical protein
MTTPERTQELLLLGEIKGIVQSLKDGQDIQAKKLDAMDGRLRKVEQKAAVIGATSGAVMSVGVALVVEGLKQWLHKGP